MSEPEAKNADVTRDDRHRDRMRRKKAAVDRKILSAGIERGVLLVHTGTGKGKSSSAFGLVARALGHGYAVAVVQFVKSRSDTGEEAFFRLQPNVTWHVMGEGFTWETQDQEKDAAAARRAWEQARVFLRDPAISLLVLDEMTYAFKNRWLDLADVLRELAARPPGQHVVITGRGAPDALVAAADTVTEMSMVKHAFSAGIKAMPGIEF